MKTTPEWCPNCGHEVELENLEVLKRLTCPNCKEAIIPCNQCIDHDCVNCVL